MKVTIYKDFDDFRANGKAGAICFCESVEHGVQGFAYKCAGCGHESYLPVVAPPEIVKKNKPEWNWDGNRELPTLKPSIFHNKEKGGCGWHGYLTKGIFTSV